MKTLFATNYFAGPVLIDCHFEQHSHNFSCIYFNGFLSQEICIFKILLIKNQCSDILFFKKGIYWVYLKCLLIFFAAQKIRNAIVNGISVSVFCLLSKIRNQITWGKPDPVPPSSPNPVPRRITPVQF